MSDERRIEIVKQLTNNPDTVNFLCSLPDDRHPIVFAIMKLVKLLEYQIISDSDLKAANDVLQAYIISGTQKIALMAFMYGKIQGKREERRKRL